MYRFSRALFRDLRPLVAPPPVPRISDVEASRRLIAACEAAVSRVARRHRTDARFLDRSLAESNQARYLLDEVSLLFPLSAHPQVLTIATRLLRTADEVLAEEAQRRRAPVQCQALASGGARRCRRPAPSGSDYCASHAHLAEDAAA